MSCAPSIAEACELAAHDWSVQIAPSTGAILSCAYKASEVLRPISHQANWIDDPFSVSYFPLAPYSNRIRNGRFEFDGKVVRLEPNAPGHAHPLHGTAWRGAWSVVDQREDSIAMRYDNPSYHNWPWAFVLKQDIFIDEDSLSIQLTLENKSHEPMPAGLGFHPYFSDPDMARLRFTAEGVWRSDSVGLPVERISVPEEWSFADWRALRGLTFDHCFTGWSGRASIDWSDRPFGLELIADPALDFAVVYVSQEERCFCFEPVSQMNDALNWASKREDTGLRILDPGKIWTAKMTLRIRESVERR